MVGSSGFQRPSVVIFRARLEVLLTCVRLGLAQSPDVVIWVGDLKRCTFLGSSSCLL